MWLSKKNIKKGVRQGFSSEAPFHWTKDLCAKDGVALSTDFELSRIIPNLATKERWISVKYQVLTPPVQRSCLWYVFSLVALWLSKEPMSRAVGGTSPPLCVTQGFSSGAPCRALDERFVRKRMGCTEYRLERPGIPTWALKRRQKRHSPPPYFWNYTARLQVFGNDNDFGYRVFSKAIRDGKKMAQSKFPTAL